MLNVKLRAGGEHGEHVKRRLSVSSSPTRPPTVSSFALYTTIYRFARWPINHVLKGCCSVLLLLYVQPLRGFLWVLFISWRIGLDCTHAC